MKWAILLKRSTMVRMTIILSKAGSPVKKSMEIWDRGGVDTGKGRLVAGWTTYSGCRSDRPGCTPGHPSLWKTTRSVRRSSSRSVLHLGGRQGGSHIPIEGLGSGGTRHEQVAVRAGAETGLVLEGSLHAALDVPGQAATTQEPGRIEVGPWGLLSSFCNWWERASGLMLQDPGQWERVKLNWAKNRDQQDSLGFRRLAEWMHSRFL